MPRERYKLIAGIHVGPDYSQEPVVKKNPTTGEETQTYPSKTYETGQVVESPVDLVARFPNKFQKLAGRERQEGQTFDPGLAQFPGGSGQYGHSQSGAGYYARTDGGESHRTGEPTSGSAGHGQGAGRHGQG